MNSCVHSFAVFATAGVTEMLHTTAAATSRPSWIFIFILPILCLLTRYGCQFVTREMIARTPRLNRGRPVVKNPLQVLFSSHRWQLLAARLRSRMSFLQHVTPLHIFVVTLRCEHSCPYCQVSRQSTDRSRFDMSEETAMRALDMAFASPAARIKIEFQGGEPLLNFPMIKTIVAAAKSRSSKKVDFVIASNLALLDDVVLDFCKANNALRTEAACATLRTEAMCETAGPGFRLKSVIFKENLSVSVKAPVVKKARVVKKSHRRLRPFAWD